MRLNDHCQIVEREIFKNILFLALGYLKIGKIPVSGIKIPAYPYQFTRSKDTKDYQSSNQLKGLISNLHCRAGSEGGCFLQQSIIYFFNFMRG